MHRGKKRSKSALKVRSWQLGEGYGSLRKLRDELDEMTDVLLGRADMPVDNGVMSLMEVSTAYYARASEITNTIHRGEVDGTVAKGSSPYKFRTGELRTFMEMAKVHIELGSRRVTAAKMEFEMETEGL